MIGIADDEFIRGNIPMTKQEIRILTLTKAKIKKTDTILDIGAGTGSLSIEAALLADQGKVFAVEQKAEGIELIHKNATKFAVENLTAIEGAAPQALSEIPPCDVIFIGGSGKYLVDILNRCDSLLKPDGRLILNCITIQTLYESIAYMKQHSSYTYEAIQVQVTRLNKVGPYDMAQALNPIHIITCQKNIKF
jgi:precorrin-6Y C5,15-methyltransferase (decarboxylating) CbiT subunit